MSGYFAHNREQSGNKEVKQPPAVAALGRIEPGSEIINVHAGFSPDRLESLFVARGDLVKKDQVLGYLGSHAEQIAQRDMYRAQLKEAKLRLKTELELDRSRIEAAEIHQRQILEVSPCGSRHRWRRSRVSRPSWPTTRTSSLHKANCSLAALGPAGRTRIRGQW